MELVISHLVKSYGSKQVLKDCDFVFEEGRITIFSTHLLDVAVDLCDEIVLLNHGKLEPIDKNNLGDSDLKEKIIAAFRL